MLPGLPSSRLPSKTLSRRKRRPPLRRKRERRRGTSRGACRARPGRPRSMCPQRKPLASRLTSSKPLRLEQSLDRQPQHRCPAVRNIQCRGSGDRVSAWTAVSRAGVSGASAVRRKGWCGHCIRWSAPRVTSGLLQLRAIAEPAEQFLLNHAKAARPLPADHFALLYAAIASINSMLGQFCPAHRAAARPQSERAMMDLAFQWSNPEYDASSRSMPIARTAAKPCARRQPRCWAPPSRRPRWSTMPITAWSTSSTRDLGPIFFEETDDLLPQIDQNLRQWRAHPADETAPNGLMRLLHTIKGSARMAGAMRFGQMIHEMETRVEEAIGLPEVPETLVDQLLAQYDQAFTSYEALKQPAQTARRVWSRPPCAASGPSRQRGEGRSQLPAAAEGRPPEQARRTTPIASREDRLPRLRGAWPTPARGPVCAPRRRRADGACRARSRPDGRCGAGGCCGPAGDPGTERTCSTAW